MDERELHGAFDPNFKFPPIVRPAEDAMTTLRRLDAQADVSMTGCEFCSVKREVIAMDGAVPSVVGITHEPHCPEFIPD